MIKSKPISNANCIAQRGVQLSQIRCLMTFGNRSDLNAVQIRQNKFSVLNKHVAGLEIVLSDSQGMDFFNPEGQVFESLAPLGCGAK